MTGKILKKALSFMLCLTLAVALAAPCFAQGNERVIASYSEDLGNGITAVTTITQTVTRSTTSTTKATNYYSGGQYIGQAALYGSFYYDGSIARATGASGAGSGANGWSYGGQSTGTSGNRAYLNATISSGSHSVPVSLSLTCSPSGNIS